MKVVDAGKNNTLLIDETVKSGVSIEVYGDNNLIRIGKDCRVNGLLMEIRGNDCTIEIGESCALRGIFRCRADRNAIRIGAHTTMGQARILLLERGAVTIGADCMFSSSITVSVSDSHSIFDRATGRRVNPPADVIIGDHVWIGEGVTVAKGCQIGSGSIVGAMSFARGRIPENVVAAGVPARVVRENVEWSRDLRA